MRLLEKLPGMWEVRKIFETALLSKSSFAIGAKKEKFKSKTKHISHKYVRKLDKQ